MQLQQLSVMVVEDHGLQRRLAVRLLGELGIATIDEAGDGESALAQLAVRVPPPDVVLVDLDLPGMDGIELIGHLAQRGLAHAVVIASALDAGLLRTIAASTRPEGLRVLGALQKPLTAAALGAMLATYEGPAPHVGATRSQASLPQHAEAAPPA